MNGWIVYILQSDFDGTFYIGSGSTSSLELRLAAHNKGKVRSTKSRILWKVAYTEFAKSRQVAYRRERQIKSYKGGQAFKKLLT